jgi:single-strand DNA-binding protein
MARSLNKAQLIGRLGKDPEVKNFSNGGSVVTFSVATSDQWKDRNTGEKRERTEWHRVAIFSEPVGRVAQQYLRKGDQVYIEGKMETRKWTDQQGQERYTTEVVLRPYQGVMTLLGGRNSSADQAGGQRESSSQQTNHTPQGSTAESSRGSTGGYGYQQPGFNSYNYPDDEIPF